MSELTQNWTNSYGAKVLETLPEESELDSLEKKMKMRKENQVFSHFANIFQLRAIRVYKLKSQS